MKVFLNNQLHERESLSEILEPGYLFGWGAFETMRTVSDRIPDLDEHIVRLEAAMATLGLEKTDIEWEKEIRGVLEQNDLLRENAYIRITVYKKRKHTGVMIYTDRFGYYPPGSYEEGFKVVVSPYARYSHPDFAKVKSLSYGYNRLSWLYAQKQGKDEALVSDITGHIIGGARSNLFMVKENTLYIPKRQPEVFEGITAQKVYEIAGTLGLSIREKHLQPSDIVQCDEAFLTSSLLYVMPLVEFEGKNINGGSPGELSRKILTRYQEQTCG